MFSVCKQTHPATGIEHSISCRFFNNFEENIVTAGANILKVFRITPDVDPYTTEKFSDLRPPKMRLECVATYELFGNVMAIQSVSLSGSQRDALLIGFKDAKLSVVQHDPDTFELKTLSLHYFEEEDIKGGWIGNYCVLMQINNFHDDVKFGRTKLFIRSPKTLFALEQKRNEMIPVIVTFLQKQVRGWICRQKYKKMCAAVTIMRCYNEFKRRKYMEELANKFRYAKNMKDYGKSIVWPQPPISVRKSEPGLRMLYNKWRASMLLRKFPRSEWAQLRLQIAAASALKQRRKFWGQNRRWLGNYLTNPTENTNYSHYNASINNLRNSDHHFSKVLFSSFVKKFNHCNKSADRAIILNESTVYKLDGYKNKFKNMSQTIEIKDLLGISVSPGKDQLIVFHSPKENDLVVSLQGEDNPLKEDRIGELVAIVAKRYFELNRTDIPVFVGSTIPCKLGQKQRNIIIEGVTGLEQPIFKHSGNSIIFEVPSAYCNSI